MKLIFLPTLLAASMLFAAPTQQFKVHHTDAQWQKLLPHGSYLILRKAATEKPYTGKYWNNHAKGKYECLACGQVVFSSDTKFESGTGWPSFFREIAKGRTLKQTDHSAGMDRTEVLCSRCGSHLGHVFDDGPKPTGLRYCLNSAALKFVPAPKGKK